MTTPIPGHQQHHQDGSSVSGADNKAVPSNEPLPPLAGSFLSDGGGARLLLLLLLTCSLSMVVCRACASQSSSDHDPPTCYC